VTLLSNIKQTLRIQRKSGHPVVRYGIRSIDFVRALVRACRSFVIDDQYRTITLLKWFEADHLHQTTPLTWIDRYPQIFSACRDFFDGRPAIRILSFGCSSGEEVITLRRYFPSAYIIGAEINPQNLALCRKRQTDDRIAFVHSDRAMIARQGPFDLIFCMAVLQRTPHWVEANRIPSLKKLYPFEKFDHQVNELDSLLKKNGVLVIHHTQYFFRDSSVAAKYDVLEVSEVPTMYNSKFDRNSVLVKNAVSDGSIFIKIRE
jgi:SAM-dependent methyltransferase